MEETVQLEPLVVLEQPAGQGYSESYCILPQEIRIGLINKYLRLNHEHPSCKGLAPLSTRRYCCQVDTYCWRAFHILGKRFAYLAEICRCHEREKLHCVASIARSDEWERVQTLVVHFCALNIVADRSSEAS